MTTKKARSKAQQIVDILKVMRPLEICELGELWLQQEHETYNRMVRHLQEKSKDPGSDIVVEEEKA